jgi:hypothetical protein
VLSFFTAPLVFPADVSFIGAAESLSKAELEILSKKIRLFK